MHDPLTRFQAWLADATGAGEVEPTRMALATADRAGRPSVRMVLLKQADAEGFVFYTNLGSPKASDLQANPVAELCFYWTTTRRQVRVAGHVEPVSAAVIVALAPEATSMTGVPLRVRVSAGTLPVMV
jgi:pyridoxamine 5'-phosphate oxidase